MTMSQVYVAMLVYRNLDQSIRTCWEVH